MVDDVNPNTEASDSKAHAEAIDRARLAKERREAEQRKRLEELRAHAAAAQAQREKRDEERRRRQNEQRARDEDRRLQVEERKRAIWEASISRREALLQRERDRTERIERTRAHRSAPRPAFAFGSSTPRLLEPVDSSGFFWAARSTNPTEQLNFFESLAASTSNVMFASAPLTRRASALHLDDSNDSKDEGERQATPAMWSSVARRRTDLVPTLPAPRPECRSGETTPGSRPGSAMSTNTTGGVVRRPTSTPRRPRPASIAGTGVHTPRGGGDTSASSLATTPVVSRDSTVVGGVSGGGGASNSGGGDVIRRPAPNTPRRPRPASAHIQPRTVPILGPGEGKPPPHRKPKSSKDQDKGRGKSLSASPGRTLSPSPNGSKEPSQDKEIKKPPPPELPVEKGQVCPREVTEKLEALQIQNQQSNENLVEIKQDEQSKPLTDVQTEKSDINVQKVQEVKKVVEKFVEEESKGERQEEKKLEKPEDNEMSASMVARRITTEEEAKAALAERRRKAREEFEKQAELERQRLQREAEEEAERQRQEEERQRREEEEAKELAALQRRMEEEKLRQAIEAQQKLEREEAERKVREETERQQKLKEEEEKRKQAEEAEKLRREEAEREEKERLARKQRVEAIMARTRLKKAEEDKKAAEKVAANAAPMATPADNGNNTPVQDLLGLNTSQAEQTKPVEPATNNGTSAPASAPPTNGNVADLLGLSQQHSTEDKPQDQSSADITPNSNFPVGTNNGNLSSVNVDQNSSNVGHISANFIQTEIEQTKVENVQKLDDFATHNGHGNSHPLTLQNAI